jgi:two-component system, NarL family, invasion response regulator UvrY
MKILLLDDHAVVRQSLEYIIHEAFPDAVCTEAATGESCISQLKKQDFDLVILDMNLPDMDGISIAEWILNRNPEQMILFFSTSPTAVYAKKLYQMGIRGYINKQSDLHEVTVALRTILVDKKQYLNKEFTQLLAQDLMNPGGGMNPVDRLSTRELTIAQLLANGRSNEEIATQLNVEPSTIRTYKTRIFQKMEVGTLHDFLNKAKLYKLL